MTVLFNNTIGNTRYLHTDAKGFIEMFPELRDSLQTVQEHFRGFTGITIRLETKEGHKEFSFEKLANDAIPTLDETV